MKDEQRGKIFQKGTEQAIKMLQSLTRPAGALCRFKWPCPPETSHLNFNSPVSQEKNT